MKTKLIKYCPNCKKKVAVVKGGKPNKQRYKCSECNKRFVDRKYGIEIRSLAVKLREYGYTLREIANVFDCSPNSIRNWGNVNDSCHISEEELTEKLKKYKVVSESIDKLKLKINKLQIEQERATKYWELHNERQMIGKRLDEIQVGSYYVSKDFQEIMRLDSRYKEIRARMENIKKSQDNLSVDEIEAELFQIENEYKAQIESKVELETQIAFVRELNNIDQIISMFEQVLHKE